MAVKLKRLVGEGGAGMDDSSGADNLYDVLKGLVSHQDDVITQFNSLRASVVAGAAFPIVVTAVALTAKVTAE